MMDVAKGQELLLKQVGKKYVFGWEVDLNDPDPRAFDCSEFVQWLFHQLGAKMPDGSWNQYEASIPVVTPGPLDLGFLRYVDGPVFHVVVRYDDFWCINPKGAEIGVIKEEVRNFEKNITFAGWRRPKCLLT